jgi:hypothetical protein
VKKILVIICLALIFSFLFISPFFIRVKVDCKSQYGICPFQILDKLNFFNGKSLFIAKSGMKKILKSDFLVSGYSIQFKIPNILHAEILVKKAVAAFRVNKSQSEILVDKEGIVLSTAQDSVLPVIDLEENLPGVGQNIGSANLFALNLAGGVYQMYQVRESSIREGSLLVELPGQIRVIFPLDGDRDALLGSLRLIYSKIQEDGNLAGYSQIDLRFKNPVLK